MCTKPDWPPPARRAGPPAARVMAGLWLFLASPPWATAQALEATAAMEGTANDPATVFSGPRQGCLTRAPDFWATHPAILGHYLPASACGDPQGPESGAYTLQAAIEDLCSVGKDGPLYGGGPAQAHLVRECTAAHLNVAASSAGGGDCERALPPLRAMFRNCCGAESALSGEVLEDYGVGRCISLLGAFNTTYDTLASFGPLAVPGPADEAACEAARDNGVINPR